MRESLTGKQVDGRQLVPEGWEGKCVVCQRTLKRWHFGKEAVVGQVEGPLVAAACRHHIHRVTPVEAAKVGHLLAAEMERLRGSIVIGQVQV